MMLALLVCALAAPWRGPLPWRQRVMNSIKANDRRFGKAHDRRLVRTLRKVERRAPRRDIIGLARLLSSRRLGGRPPFIVVDWVGRRGDATAIVISLPHRRNIVVPIPRIEVEANRRRRHWYRFADYVVMFSKGISRSDVRRIWADRRQATVWLARGGKDRPCSKPARLRCFNRQITEKRAARPRSTPAPTAYEHPLQPRRGNGKPHQGLTISTMPSYCMLIGIRKFEFKDKDWPGFNLWAKGGAGGHTILFCNGDPVDLYCAGAFFLNLNPFLKNGQNTITLMGKHRNPVYAKLGTIKVAKEIAKSKFRLLDRKIFRNGSAGRTLRFNCRLSFAMPRREVLKQSHYKRYEKQLSGSA